MRGKRFRARGAAAWLVTGVLGTAGSAWAESEPCACIPTNQSVVSEQPCLVIGTEGCGASRVRNGCDVAVTLMDWPLPECPGPQPWCSTQLQPGEEVSFDFANLSRREEPGGAEFFAEESYVVMVDGEERNILVTADVVCAPSPVPEEEGCASAPGALAALGVLVAGPVLLRRREG